MRREQKLVFDVAKLVLLIDGLDRRKGARRLGGGGGGGGRKQREKTEEKGQR